MSASYFNSVSRLNVITGVEAYTASADPIYGTGMDGDAALDGSSTVLGMIPVSSVYSMTRDLHFNNLTINSGIRLSPNGYRIFVKNILTFNGQDATIGFNSGYSNSTSVLAQGWLGAVSHSLGGSATGYVAIPPTAAEGGAEYYYIPHNAVRGYSITASASSIVFLRGGAGTPTEPGGGVVIISARYITGPVSGTAYIKAPATPPAGGGVIFVISSTPELPANITTDVTGQNSGTYRYMQVV